MEFDLSLETATKQYFQRCCLFCVEVCLFHFHLDQTMQCVICKATEKYLFCDTVWF